MRPFAVLVAALAVGVGGCSLLSLDDLQHGATGTGGASASSQSTSSQASSTNGASTTTASSSASNSASASDATSSSTATSSDASTSATSSSTGAGPGDTAWIAAIKADQPIAWYRLGETSASMAALDQIGAKNGSYSGIVTPGQPSAFPNTTDTAVKFGGGHVTITHPELVSPTGAFSLEAWVIGTTLDTNHRGIIDEEWLSSGAREGIRLYLWRTSGGVAQITFGRTDAVNGQDLILPYPDDAAYHHVVATYDGALELCIYIDGVGTCDTLANVAITGTPVDVVIGARPITGTANNFAGTVDEVVLYDKRLDQMQVSNHWAAHP